MSVIGISGWTVEADFSANANNSQKQVGAGAQRPSSARVDLQVTGGGHAPIRAMTALKPFFIVACVAFVTGFAGYCALYRLRTAPPEPVEAQAPGPSVVVADPAPPHGFIPGRRI
ncbi:MAG TPA: hypothetical protein VFH92_09040 [Phenylobacterium sp.]|nr:hypothetical protein [Phenylobacterium sp.]